MRLASIFSAGCAGISYEISNINLVSEPSCVEDGAYILCDQPTTHERAEAICEAYAAYLIDATESPDPKLEQDTVAELAARILTVDRWWIGWPDTYECPSSDHFGSAYPTDCELLLGSVCEIYDEEV